ncbi:replication-relaxation family protein [Nocardia abscessus]|uniref:replication-relaxation family protein n=1 Tax=Nocardia abscessus TaxID=120957 RepID=UPI0006848FE3|nr:replication-relaxation family protein [Nocardia abscessus]MCC3329469.1 replication-relaxation family protein [Nocardia abscessus]
MTARQPRQASIASRQGPSIADAITAQRQLTPRDLALLGLLAAHRALTAQQITRLLFTDANTARKRLVLLTGRGVLARFRACVRPGSQEYRYTLGPLGAMIHAAATDAPIPTPRTVHEKTLKLSRNPQLDHLLGINEFFTALCHHARTDPGCELVEWWDEREATKACAEIAHPDGYGVWSEHGRTVRFFLEYDTGTEDLSRLIEKLQGYRDLRSGDITIPVLFVLPGPKRQNNFHRLLTQQPATLTGLTVATATLADIAAEHPAAPVWWLAGHTTRHRLAALPAPPPATLAA